MWWFFVIYSYRNYKRAKPCIKTNYQAQTQACKLTKQVTYSRKIFKIYLTIQNFDWIGGGVTYQRATDPNLSRNDGLSK